jgi:8-oxo-dGTP diphosphatase
VSRKEILAAGAVLWRATAQGPEIAVEHRPRYDDWSLPKGKLDPGETLQAAAVREVLEETGFSSVLGAHLGTARYQVPGADKTVEYYSARVTGGEFVANEEVDELRWCTPGEAGSLFSYPHDAEIVTAFTAMPMRTRTLLLVRHAKAGDRKEWLGHDDDRPLSDAGWNQAKALRGWLPLFGPTRVHAAPRVRCRDTVSGLAADLHTDVVAEPLLSEEGYWVDPAAGIARLLALVDSSDVLTVCSQGGVIPSVVTELAARNGLPLDRIRSKKGSVWVLTFDAHESGRLHAADYYANALPAPRV